MNDNLTATIFDIQKNSFIDGPGIRTTVLFKGCKSVFQQRDDVLEEQMCWLRQV